MFTTLIESRSLRRPRRRAGTVASVTAHAALLALAVSATARAVPRPPAPPDPAVVFVAPPPSTPATRAPTTASHGRGAPGETRRPTPVPSAPTVPAFTTPRIDLPAGAPLPPARGDDFARSLGNAGPPATPGSPGIGTGDGVWSGDVVDMPAAPVPGNPPPSYPEALRSGGVEGRVVARFVVDTLGRVEPSSVEIRPGESDPRFASAVREVLPRLRFRPATIGSHRVRQRVEQPFTFAIAR